MRASRDGWRRSWPDAGANSSEREDRLVKRTLGMTLVAALSLFVGISGVLGSAAVVSDGLGLSRFSTVAGAPSIGTTSAPPSGSAVNVAVVAFGVVRVLLSLLLIAGG